MTTRAMLEPTRLPIQPGAAKACRLTVRNTGTIVESYALDIVGATAAWATTEPATLSVYPGAEATAEVRFDPPRTFHVPAGDVPVAVRVTPTGHPEDAIAPQAVICVLPFTETTAEMLPRTSKTRRRATHELAIDNRGNVPLHATLAANEPDGRLDVRMRPATVTVPPGQAVFATAAVRHRRWMWRGRTAMYPFKVVVDTRAESEQPVNEQLTLDGNSVQTPVLSKGLAGVLAAILVLLLFGAGSWFLLFRPVVRSTAREAVDAPMARVAAEASAANHKADTANTRIAGMATAPPGSPTTPAPPPDELTPVTVHLSTSLAASTTAATDAYHVPAKTTLVLTDLVLQNPQGDTGRIDVLVNNQPILILSLANFRDLDYHFGTPIEVPAGKTLSIQTLCQTAGPPIAGSSTGLCRVWMLGSGNNRAAAAA